MSTSIRMILLSGLLVLTGCGAGTDESGEMELDTVTAEDPLPADAQARSLLGEVLYAPELSDEVREEREADLQTALGELQGAPEDADALIWVGRRHAYLGDYREAIDVYTRGIELYSEDARLYRHRGHRYISTRRFDWAENDLERAAELIEGTEDRVEPDGQPNERGIPLSTLHFNVWYHLGLVRYLRGGFEGALDAYRSCLEVADNDDGIVACSYWLYLINRRLGNNERAAEIADSITEEMEIIENTAYHELLLLYGGTRTPEAVLGSGGEDDLQNATVAYGVAAWHLLEGNEERAGEIFRDILTLEGQWAAFGYLAAEAEVARREAG